MEPSKAKTNIYDVAERAGVSIKTVSRVVNNEPNVRVKTREKVQEAITALGYMPSAAARELTGKGSRVIGLLYENSEDFSYTNKILTAALNACEEEGYTLVLRPFTLPYPKLVESVRQLKENARVEGIIVLPPLADHKALRKQLKDMALPVALIAPKSAPKDAICVRCTDEQASYDLACYVIDRGHQRIGFIKGHPDHSASAERFAGYRRALDERDISLDEQLVVQGYFNYESGKAAAKELLELPSPPTAIIASNDDMAAGTLYEARELGLSVPGQLSITGFDDTALASHLWPPLTTVKQPITEMTTAATRGLIQKIQGNEPEPSQPFSCEMVVRDSTA
ncbi:MAG: LacI family DNA-binding transcriptional regulator [Pseudomonadales bacterium]